MKTKHAKTIQEIKSKNTVVSSSVFHGIKWNEKCIENRFSSSLFCPDEGGITSVKPLPLKQQTS
jgi:hypothetical protein